MGKASTEAGAHARSGLFGRGRPGWPGSTRRLAPIQRVHVRRQRIFGTVVLLAYAALLLVLLQGPLWGLIIGIAVGTVPLLVAAMVPMLSLKRIRREVIDARGRMCGSCGHLLTVPRCPECGLRYSSMRALRRAWMGAMHDPRCGRPRARGLWLRVAALGALATAITASGPARPWAFGLAAVAAAAIYPEAWLLRRRPARTTGKKGTASPTWERQCHAEP